MWKDARVLLKMGDLLLPCPLLWEQPLIGPVKILAVVKEWPQWSLKHEREGTRAGVWINEDLAHLAEFSHL